MDVSSQNSKVFSANDKSRTTGVFTGTQIRLPPDSYRLLYHRQNTEGKIDKFINAVFCANIPVPQIIEIHMELIDEFSKQLKLEGRSDETLLDYRLTLIDILAHLCELYRRSLLK